MVTPLWPSVPAVLTSAFRMTHQSANSNVKLPKELPFGTCKVDLLAPRRLMKGLADSGKSR
jgi:hypothetical protein